MPSIERIKILCQRVEEGLEYGSADPFHATDVATALLLAVGSLERRVDGFGLPAAAQARVLAELAEARTVLERSDVTLHTAAAIDRQGDLLEASRLVLGVTSVLLRASSA